MTVYELRKQLELLPGDLDVQLQIDNNQVDLGHIQVDADLIQVLHVNTHEGETQAVLLIGEGIFERVSPPDLELYDQSEMGGEG